MSNIFSRSSEPMSAYNFAYTTVSNIRNIPGASITVENASDLTVSKYIENASKYINLVTEQWFEPIHLISAFTGRGTPYLNLHGVAPIINLKSAEIIFERSMSTYVSDMPFSISGSVREDYLSIGQYGRCIQSKCPWPEGHSNVMVNGWFGMVEQPKFIETAVLSGVVTSGTVSVVLDELVQDPVLTFGDHQFENGSPLLGFDNAIKARDVVIFLHSSGRELARRIVNSLNYTTGEITFDPLLSNPIYSIDSGCKVVVYGCVPSLIEEACNQLVRDSYDPSLLELRGLKSEKTDNYQYTKFTAQEGGTFSLEEISSSSRVNNIIYQFMAPGFVSM